MKWGLDAYSVGWKIGNGPKLDFVAKIKAFGKFMQGNGNSVVLVKQ